MLSSMDNSSESCSPDVPATGASESVRTCKSCNLCKKMKIRCVRRGDSCSHCISKNVECTIRNVKKRKTQPKRADHYGSMEDRLKRLEAVLAATAVKNSEPPAAPENAATIKEAILKQSATPDRLSTFTSSKGSSKYVGASSGFSLFSPQGLQWIRARVGRLEFERLMIAISESHQVFAGFDTTFFHPTTVRTPLPQKQTAESYVNAFFSTFNTIFPIYDETNFKQLASQQYSTNPPEGAAWYACFNIILAMGCLIAADHELSISDDNAPSDPPVTLAWKYFRNASSQVVDLIFGPSSLRVVQALVTMAFMLQMSPDPNPTSLITAAACRMAHAIGLHRQADDTGLESAVLRERKNVFWLVYFLESNIALRSGRPSAIHEQDIGIGLPDRLEPNIGQDFTPSSTHFHSIAILAVLENRANSELYSAKARTRSRHETFTIISQLDAELIRWRDQVPIEIRPECEIRCEPAKCVPIVMMHFAYYNCLAAIHRASMTYAAWTCEEGSSKSAAIAKLEQEKVSQTYGPRVAVSTSICVAAARSVIGLLKHFNSTSLLGSQRSLIWMASYYPLSSSLVLFANTLEYPAAPSAVSDIELMSQVTSFLGQSSELAKQSNDILGIFRELNQIAALAVREAQLKILAISTENEQANSARGIKAQNRSLDTAMTFEGSTTALNQGTTQHHQAALGSSSLHHYEQNRMGQSIETSHMNLPARTASNQSEQYHSDSGLDQNYHFESLNLSNNFGEIDGLGHTWEQNVGNGYEGGNGNNGPMSMTFPWDLSYFWSGYQPADRS